MFNRVWTTVAVALVIVPVVTLIAIRPEMADNPNIWGIVIMALPGLIATFKAEESSKKAQEGTEQVTAVRRELKNGTITKVVHDAVIEVMKKHGVEINAIEDDNDPR